MPPRNYYKFNWAKVVASLIDHGGDGNENSSNDGRKTPQRRGENAPTMGAKRPNVGAKTTQYGMIGYYVPHSTFPAGYHCDPKQPLPFASLASQKNHMALYLMCIYGDAKLRKWFESACKASGKKPDMGQCCVRFKKLEDLPLDVVGKTIARVPVADYVARYEQTLKVTRSRKKK